MESSDYSYLILSFTWNKDSCTHDFHQWNDKFLENQKHFMFIFTLLLNRKFYVWKLFLKFKNMWFSQFTFPTFLHRNIFMGLYKYSTFASLFYALFQASYHSIMMPNSQKGRIRLSISNCWGPWNLMRKWLFSKNKTNYWISSKLHLITSSVRLNLLPDCDINNQRSIHLHMRSMEPLNSDLCKVWHFSWVELVRNVTLGLKKRQKNS